MKNYVKNLCPPDDPFPWRTRLLGDDLRRVPPRYPPPPVLRRVHARLIAALALIGAANGLIAFDAIAWDGWSRYGLPGAFLDGLVTLGPIVLVFWWAIRTERRLRTKARRAEGRLCLRCAYDLSALDEPQKCPECGTAVAIVENIERWRGAS